MDSNPYGLLNEAGARFVADAGGNSLIQVMANGATNAVATFPSLPAPPPFSQSEAVPTEVQRGPDGALYVGSLSGVPFLSGNARIYRVVPGQAPTVYIGGLRDDHRVAVCRMAGSMRRVCLGAGLLRRAGEADLRGT